MENAYIVKALLIALKMPAFRTSECVRFAHLELSELPEFDARKRWQALRHFALRLCYRSKPELKV